MTRHAGRRNATRRTSPYSYQAMPTARSPSSTPTLPTWPQLRPKAWQRNPFATIVDGRLHLKRRDALEVSAQVRALRRVMDTHLPRVRIEDLLREVDTWCQFTRALRPLVGVPPLAERFYPTLLAALVAHGTNLGIALMGESTEGITVDMLHEVSHACLRTDTLKRANTALVDYHHQPRPQCGVG